MGKGSTRLAAWSIKQLQIIIYARVDKEYGVLGGYFTYLKESGFVASLRLLTGSSGKPEGPVILSLSLDTSSSHY